MLNWGDKITKEAFIGNMMKIGLDKRISDEYIANLINVNVLDIKNRNIDANELALRLSDRYDSFTEKDWEDFYNELKNGVLKDFWGE